MFILIYCATKLYLSDRQLFKPFKILHVLNLMAIPKALQFLIEQRKLFL